MAAAGTVPALVVLIVANAVAAARPQAPLRSLIAAGPLLTALLFLFAISRTWFCAQLCVQVDYVQVARSAWPERWAVDVEDEPPGEVAARRPTRRWSATAGSGWLPAGRTRGAGPRAR